jgi:hypothetical protein
MSPSYYVIHTLVRCVEARRTKGPGLSTGPLRFILPLVPVVQDYGLIVCATGWATRATLPAVLTPKA